MHHQPDNYLCPFCDWLAGNETEHKRNSDIVLQNKHITAFISPKWWPNNPGSVIVIPNHHTENAYDIDDDSFVRAMNAARQLAIAIRTTYPECTGTTIRQHNEPDGNQSVWHFHIHVLPRYPNDSLYENHANGRFVNPDIRSAHAMRLRKYFENKSAK